MPEIRLHRGLKATIPTFDEGEPAFATDTQEFFVGSANGNIKLAKQIDLDTTNANIATNTNAIYNIGTINANAELVNSRGTYSQLVDRLNASDASLTDIATNVKSFSSSSMNGDWAPAFQAAHDALPSSGGKILFNGSYTIKSPLVFTKKVTFEGQGHSNSSSPTSQGASVIIKDGNFVGITVQGDGSVLRDFQLDGATGNGNDGIIVASSRVSGEHVTVSNQGGNGYRIGNDASANCNAWRILDLVTLNNGGHGLLVHDSQQQTLPNTNAGLALGIDARNNGGDGVHLGYAIDSVFMGVCAQYNVGYGVQMADYARGNKFYSTYTEANTAGDIILTTNATRNEVWGFREGVSNDNIVDNGSQNFIMGRDNQYNSLPYFKSPFSVFNFNVTDPSISGVWNYSQDNTNRDLLIQLLGTSSNANVKIQGVNGQTITTKLDKLNIGNGTGTITKFLRQGATLNYGTIPANSFSDKTVTVTGATFGDHCQAAKNLTALEGGLGATAFVSAADTVTVRITNPTTSPVSMTLEAWTVLVTKSA